MARFEDYAGKYQTIRMERRDGILQITFHTNGGPLQWGLFPHREFPEAFRDIGSDPDNKAEISPVWRMRNSLVLYSRSTAGTPRRHTPARTR